VHDCCGGYSSLRCLASHPPSLKDPSPTVLPSSDLTLLTRFGHLSPLSSTETYKPDPDRKRNTRNDLCQARPLSKGPGRHLLACRALGQFSLSRHPPAFLVAGPQAFLKGKLNIQLQPLNLGRPMLPEMVKHPAFKLEAGVGPRWSVFHVMSTVKDS